MGLLSGIGGSTPSLKGVQKREAYEAGEARQMGNVAQDKLNQYAKDNPYNKGYHDYVRTEAEGAVSGEERAALTEANEHEQKYGGQDTGDKRRRAIRRAGMGARANARRQAYMEFLAARTGLDMQLMAGGHQMAMDASNQQLGNMFNRAQMQTQTSMNRWGMIKDVAGMASGGMASGASGVASGARG